MTEPEKPRKRTPRVPAHLLYEWIVPIALVVMGLVLLVVIAIAVIGLVNAIR